MTGADPDPDRAAAAATETDAGIGHRRYVAVLFANVSDSSVHAEQLEAEDYAEVLNKFRHIAREVIPYHGGSIARLQGDGLLALFGHLESREDDGRRATEAALDLHAAVARLTVGTGSGETRLALHSGIHAGLVLLVEGDIERGRIDVVGEVANTAARLCALAASGEIFVSDETLGPHAHFFRISEPRRTPIRGRSAPLNVRSVQDRATLARRIDAAARRGVVPFIGRDGALAELGRLATRARAGELVATLVSGEPGIGKTRLLDEFQRRLGCADYRVLQGYCESYLGAEPLQPFMHLIRCALGWRSGAPLRDNEAAVAAALRALSAEAGPELVPKAQALLGGRAVAAGAVQSPLRVSTVLQLITLLAQAPRTLVLVLDDWQWADDASRHALETLRGCRLRLLILLASRPSNDDDHALLDVPVLRLEPLVAREGEAAINAWLPDVEPFAAQEIFRQSGGSPLFIEELCHAAAAGTGLPDAAQRHPGVAWISKLVASRLERLPEAQAECLRAAAVAGYVFASWTLERLMGKDEAQLLLEALAGQDFLVPAGQPGMLRFKHVLTRDAVYATVEPARRRALHRRVAHALEQAAGQHDAFAWLEALSYHYDAAGLNERAAHFAEAAGDKALAAMSLDRARAQFMTALRALDALPGMTVELQARWCSIAEKLGQTCVFDPLDVAHGFVLFERAALLARATGDLNRIARAEYWLAYVNYGKGRPREAVRHGELALSHAEASKDTRLAAQVQATLAQALASSGRYAEAMPLFARALESKRQQSRAGSSVAIGSAYTLGRMGYTFGDLGRFDEAEAHFAEALELLGDNVHSVAASVRELMCAVYLWQGRWEDARAIGSAGAEIAMRCHSRYLVAMGRALSACADWALDGDAAALQALREPTHWIEARGGAVSTSLNYGWLVDVSATLGQEREMRHYAARLFMRARAQDRHGEAQGCRALARHAAQHGDLARVGHYLDLADRTARFRGSARELAVNQLARAEAAAALGKPAQARELAARALEAFERMRMAWHAGRARAVMASA